MKNFFLLIFSFFINLSLYAQTQYDYYDDGAVAGGADRALHGILIIGGIVIVVVVLALLLGGAAKIYFWFNPQEDPKYKRETATKKIKSEKIKEQATQNDSHSYVSEKQSTKEDIGDDLEIYNQKAPVKQKEAQKNDKNNISISDSLFEFISTTVTKDEIADGIEDDFGVVYSRDGIQLLKSTNYYITSYQVKEGCKIIRSNAFLSNRHLLDVTLPESLLYIGNYAFSQCVQLTGINILCGILMPIKILIQIRWQIYSANVPSLQES